MKKDIALQWAAELGKHKQAKHKLKAGNCYCVLGVLGLLATKAKVIDNYLNVLDPSTEQSGTPSVHPDVVKWAGLNNSSTYVSKLRQTLVHLNDTGTRFKDLAKIITDNYKGL